MAASTTTVSATGDDYIDGLVEGVKWTGQPKFSFSLELEQRLTVGALFSGSVIDWGGDGDVNGTLSLYGSLTSLINLDLKRKPPTSYDEWGDPRYSNNGDIRISNGGGFEGDFLARSPGSGNGGDIRFSPSLNGTEHDLRHPSLGNYAHLTFLQAIGQSLGLKPASTPGGVAGVAVPEDRDSLEYTVMSGRTYPGGPTGAFGAGTYAAGIFDHPQTYMALDIQALQRLYGADYSTNATNSVYRWDPATGTMSINGVAQSVPGQYLDLQEEPDSWNDGYPKKIHPGANKIFLTIWDGGGTDSYDLSNYTGDVSVDLSPGGHSLFSQAQRANLGNGIFAQGNVYNSYLYKDNPASLIENAVTGSGNDTLRGNSADNSLNGNTGADTMIGLAGDDIYYVDNLGDLVIEAAGEGTDTVYVRMNGYVLPANVENGAISTRVQFDPPPIELHGNSLANILAGNADANLLYGEAGADQLYGHEGRDHLDGGAGPDQMIGGTGNDTYIVDNLSDIVFEKPGEGTDTLWTSVNRGLDNDFENIVLFGSATIAGGNALNNTVSGNALGNDLYGGAGSDSLYGQDGYDRLIGEDGNDYMTGGKGTDAYYGGAGYDYAILEEGGGVDYFVDWNVTQDRVVFDSDIFSSIGAALKAAFQSGSDVVIWDGSDGIVLQNAKVADLTTSNFLIS